MCHLHPLHLLFCVINNYNKTIVSFNNFCAVHSLPSSHEGLRRLGLDVHNRELRELCVLDGKRGKRKLCGVKEKTWLVRCGFAARIVSACSIVRNFILLCKFSEIYLFSFFSAGKEQCNTPDSPEGARVIAPRSPMSPHIHPVNSIIPATNNRSSSVNRHNSSSPNVNGTPPPIATPSSAAALIASSSSAHDNQRLLKIRRFLGALVQFGQDTNADVGDRLRSLVLSLAVSNLI